MEKTFRIYSLFIFILIFCTLGLPFLKWGFLHDDFGAIWHVWNLKINEIGTFFTEASSSAFFQPTNYQFPEQSFLVVLYRPLCNVFYFIQRLFFGSTPYGYFLVTIFFHALNTIFVFRLFTIFFEMRYAIFGALYFGFHLSLYDWMGWIAGQQQIFNFTLMILVILFFIWFIESRKKLVLFSSVLLNLVSLFMRESIILLPFWLIPATFFYTRWKNIKISLKELCYIISPFFTVNAFYLLLRIYLYPFRSTGNGIKIPLNPLIFLKSLSYRFFDAVTFIVDLLNLSWLSGDHRLLKGSLIIAIGTFIAFLFYKNSQKKLILFLSLSLIPFMWPAILRYYSSRYLYKGLPFIIAIFILLIKYYKTRSQPQAISNKSSFSPSKVILTSLLLINGILLCNHLKDREITLHKLNVAFINLAKNPLCSKRPTLFRRSSV
jgi:hypothetical protein